MPSQAGVEASAANIADPEAFTLDMAEIEAFAAEIAESIARAEGDTKVELFPTKEENLAMLREYVEEMLESAAEGMWLADAMIDGFEWNESDKTALTSIMSRLAYWNSFQGTVSNLLDEIVGNV